MTAKKKRPGLLDFGEDLGPPVVATANEPSWTFDWSFHMSGKIGDRRWSFSFRLNHQGSDDAGYATYLPECTLKIDCQSYALSKCTPAYIDRNIREAVARGEINEGDEEDWQRECRRIVAHCWKTVAEEVDPSWHTNMVNQLVRDLKAPKDIRDKFFAEVPLRPRLKK